MQLQLRTPQGMDIPRGHDSLMNAEWQAHCAMQRVSPPNHEKETWLVNVRIRMVAAFGMHVRAPTGICRSFVGSLR